MSENVHLCLCIYAFMCVRAHPRETVSDRERRRNEVCMKGFFCPLKNCPVMLSFNAANTFFFLGERHTKRVHERKHIFLPTATAGRRLDS